MERPAKPHSEWVHEAAEDTLRLYLLGYAKENLKVQVTTTKKLRISGERRGRANELYRFHEEFLIPADCDADRVSAIFKDGILNVKIPKLIKSVGTQQKEKPKPVPSTEAPKLYLKPTNWDANQADQEQAAQKVSPKKDTGTQTTEHKDVQQKQENVADKEVPPSTNMEKPKNEKTGDWVAKTSNDVSSKAAEKEKEMDDRIGKTNEKPGVTRQVLGVLVAEIRKPRKVTNLVLAVLLVVVLGLYARNAFRFLLRGSDSEL